MPLNEAASLKRNHLTKEQKAQAEAAIYGLAKGQIMAPEISQLDIEKMRDIVAAHDVNNRPSINEFDLNNPPKVPYKHQEYPKLVYCAPKEGQHPNDAHKLVKSAEEEEALLEQGYSLSPVYEAREEESAGDDPDAISQEVAKPKKAAKKPKAKADANGG